MRKINAGPEIWYQANDDLDNIVATGKTLLEVMEASVGTSCRFYEMTSKLVGSDFLKGVPDE